MDEKLIALAEEMESLGMEKSASCLREAAGEDWLSPIRKPWIDIGERGEKLVPQTKGEKANFSRHQPLTPARRKKMMPRLSPEGAGALESVSPTSPRFRVPPSIGGWKGRPVPDKPYSIMDFIPGHAVRDELKGRGKNKVMTPTIQDDFDLNAPGFIGLLGEGDEYSFGDMPSEAVDHAKGMWGENQEEYVRDLKTTATGLERNMKEWDTDLFPMLKANFLTSSPMAIMSGDWDRDEGNTIVAAINRRMDFVEKQMSSNSDRKQNLEDLGAPEMQLFEAEQLRDALMGGDAWVGPDTFNRWSGMLTLLYKGDMDLIQDNPLGIPYPDVFEEILQAYEATRGKGGGGRRGGGRPTADDLINMEILNGITADPEKTALLKKFIDDVDSFSHFATPQSEGGFAAPSATAQLDLIDANYVTEHNKLSAAKDYLRELMTRIIQTREAGGLQAPPEQKVELEESLRAYLDTVGSLYGSNRLITNEGRLALNFGVGDNSVLEIFLKSLYLGQGWKAFHPESEIGVDEEPEVAEASNMMNTFVRIAQIADDGGNYVLANVCDRFARSVSK